MVILLTPSKPKSREGRHVHANGDLAQTLAAAATYCGRERETWCPICFRSRGHRKNGAAGRVCPPERTLVRTVSSNSMKGRIPHAVGVSACAATMARLREQKENPARARCSCRGDQARQAGCRSPAICPSVGRKPNDLVTSAEYAACAIGATTEDERDDRSYRHGGASPPRWC